MPEEQIPPKGGLDPRGPQNVQQAQQMYGALGAARWANEQGQAVPPQLQIEAFKEAGATGVSTEQMDKIFGMPAGTSAEFAKTNQLTPLRSGPPATTDQGQQAAKVLGTVFGGPTTIDPAGGIGTLPQTGTATIGDGTGFNPDVHTVYRDPVTGQITDRTDIPLQRGTPLERAQAEFASTGKISPQLQLDAFKQASFEGMSASAMENMFGMPAGTAAQFAQTNQLTPLTTGQVSPQAATGIAATTVAGTPAAGTSAQIATDIANTVTNQQGGLGTLGGGLDTTTQVAGGVGTTEGTGNGSSKRHCYC